MIDETTIAPEGQAPEDQSQTSDILEKPRRDKKGRLLPGYTANPSGAGIGTKIGVWKARRILNDALPELAQKAIDLARSGDFFALKLCVERGLPTARDEPVHFRLAAVDSSSDINTAIGDVITAMAGGQITPFEATSVAALLELKRRAIETIDIESRLLALETQRALPNGYGHGHDQ